MNIYVLLYLAIFIAACNVGSSAKSPKACRLPDSMEVVCSGKFNAYVSVKHPNLAFKVRSKASTDFEERDVNILADYLQCFVGHHVSEFTKAVRCDNISDSEEHRIVIYLYLPKQYTRLAVSVRNDTIRLVSRLSDGSRLVPGY